MAFDEKDGLDLKETKHGTFVIAKEFNLNTIFKLVKRPF